MSRNKSRSPKELSGQKTLPIQAPDRRDPQTRAARQSGENVERAKRWGEDHEV